VAHDGLRLEDDAPTAGGGAPAPVEVLDVHDVALVEPADVEERVAPNEPRCANGPVHLPPAVESPTARHEKAISYPRPAVRAGELHEEESERRESQRRFLDGVVGSDKLRSDHRGPR